MEKYAASDERPKDKCLKDVAECDYYVLILAWRYGFQPPADKPAVPVLASLLGVILSSLYQLGIEWCIIYPKFWDNHLRW